VIFLVILLLIGFNIASSLILLPLADWLQSFVLVHLGHADGAVHGDCACSISSFGPRRRRRPEL
jgi:hypothetical protein